MPRTAHDESRRDCCPRADDALVADPCHARMRGPFTFAAAAVGSGVPAMNIHRFPLHPYDPDKARAATTDADVLRAIDTHQAILQSWSRPAKPTAIDHACTIHELLAGDFDPQASGFEAARERLMQAELSTWQSCREGSPAWHPLLPPHHLRYRNGQVETSGGHALPISIPELRSLVAQIVEGRAPARIGKHKLASAPNGDLLVDDCLAIPIAEIQRLTATRYEREPFGISLHEDGLIIRLINDSDEGLLRMGGARHREWLLELFANEAKAAETSCC
ncbi:hypothetical protein [Luteimonas sp. e5]